MSKFITIAVVMLMIVLTGCAENAKIETPSWSDEQIRQMENDEIETVPFAIFKF